MKRCRVHIIRNLIYTIRKKDILDFTQDFRTIYQAPTLELAQKV
ncbi:MAG: hypothetical protein GX490_07805 [Bacilli bacterium]|nr:hypothetical protein [Bacilli bacterium]